MFLSFPIREDEEEILDVQLPEPPRPRGASISDARPQFDLKDTKETALFMLLTFFEDMRSVRDCIKALWRDSKSAKSIS